MKKLISCALSMSMLCSSFAGLAVSARAEDEVVFSHQNVVGSQTCYADDTAEKTITAIPDVIQGIRINQPVFRAANLTAGKSYTVKQELKDGTVLKEETVTADGNGIIEFKHVRNCEMLEVFDGDNVIASLGTEKTYTNGVMITYAPMSYQVFQRNEHDEAEIMIKGETETNEISVSVDIDGDEENVIVTDGTFTYTRTLLSGLHDITVKSGSEVIASYKKVGVGDIWVAAGQSNMTDMGAVTDGFVPETGDPINENMHIIYAEDTTWHEMSHPAGEGRFFKTGIRTSPVTSFAREISQSEGVPVGIVQSSVGGTNIWQWVDGVRNDPSSGYLIKALEACFDKMPSHNVKGILWYQGCNDAINENYAYNYKNLQQKVFDEMHSFFGDVPIITTQINDANQDSTSSLGYYDAWSFVKDVQRQNEELYDNVYVVSTGELELGDTIHNSASSNLMVGKKWANAAKNVVYHDSTVNFRQPTIDSAKITGDKEITLTFKNTNGLKAAEGIKRIGITNVSGGGYKIAFGDLTKEFVVRKGSNKVMTASNSGKGTELTITSAEIKDNTKVVLTTDEEVAGVVAVDCMYGKRFTPALVDADTGESVFAFYNVIAEYENAAEITPAAEITADETAALDGYHGEASDSIMYVNKFSGSQGDLTGYGLMRFDLGSIDLENIAYAQLAVYATDIDRDRSGNTTISEIKTTDWDSSATYNNPAYSSLVVREIKTINSNTAGIFPVGSYSAIDITDYMRGYEGSSIGIGLSSNYASVLTLAGKNSANPPKLIIQPGKKAELTYTCDGKPCANMEVTIEAVGATEYPTTKFTTDANGTLTLYLTEGSYKAVTAEETGAYEASENTFTISDGNVSESYEIAKNTTATPEPEKEPIYTFDDTYKVIKSFDTSSLTETKIDDKGLKLSSSSSNYNNAVIRSKSSANDGYYPYGSGLPDNGYYLFLGSGGSGNVSSTLTLPAEASGYIRITYAKPKATNNGGTERSKDNNANTIKAGTETIDLQNNCDFDTWYTTTVKLDSPVSKLDFTLGKWSAVAVSKIEVLSSADTMDFSIYDNTSEMYITPEAGTLQYNAAVYKSITTHMGSTDVIAKGSVDKTAAVTYSVNGYEGVSIDSKGLLTVTPQAKAGDVTVSAEYGGITKSLTLTLSEVSDADGVKLVGDEAVLKGGEYTFRALPTVSGTVIPERAAIWSILGNAHGCAIENGILKVPANAASGNITIKAELEVAKSQTSAGVSDTFTVTIRDKDTASPYTVKGIFLENCAEDIAAAGKVDGAVVEASGVQDGYSLVIKAVDKNGAVIAEKSVSLGSLTEGVQEVKADMQFKNAAEIKAYVVNSDNEVQSEIMRTAKGMYKNVPLVSDWITGAKSGLGMGTSVLSPKGAPYGVDPSLVDVSDLNVKYTYDGSYPDPTSDNALWYKTGAYLASSGNSNNSIYDMHQTDWEQKALPIGNGYMGGMLFGLPDKDQIQINEETFWAAGYRGVQSSVAANNVNKNMSEGINGYMSVGNIFVDFNMPKNSTVNNYYRDLNLDEAVAHVLYEYDGVKYAREYFASYPKEVLAFRYTADKAGALNFDVSPVSMHPGEVKVKDGEITITGKLKDSEPYAAGGNAAWNQESDLEYCTKIKVIADDGTITDGYNTVNVSGASGVTILVAAATDYDKDQFELNADGSVNMTKTPYKSLRGVQAAIDKAESRMSGAAAMSYDALKAEHIADYKSQFDTVHFSLTDKDEVCKTPTDELQGAYNKVIGTKSTDGTTSVSYDASAYKNLDKHLEELHYNYARYMLISSSRSTTMPANLQGKWCQSTAEIWGSCYCININMEMNYWFAGGANLLDSGKSLIRWFNSQIPAGTVTARNMYGVTPKSYTYADGKITFADSSDEADDVFIMHTKQAIMGTTDLTGSTSIQSAGNTAWLMYNLWDLYQTTGDKELLANDLYPIMRKAANFYTQYMYTKLRKTTTDKTTYPDGYYYTTWEGRSPEQGPTQEGVKYDLQLVAGMFDYTIAAAEALGADADKVAAWKEIRNHMEAPVELGADGEIKEWKDEVSYNTDALGNAIGDPHHRHISHLVGLYPGTLISRDTPEYLNGAKIVLQNRGDDSTGWSCSNKFLLWARALEGDKALELFRFQLAKKTYSNLFDTHAPFQIDGNFGSAAGVMELLMQSQTGDIYILPALPSVWDKGEITGIKAKNGAQVDIIWENNKAVKFTITPAVDGDITIGCADGEFVLNKSEKVTFENDNPYTIKNAKAGAAYTFDADGEIEAKPETKIEVDCTHVKAEGFDGGVLITAGYDSDGRLVKSDIIDGYESELSGYEACAEIKAFIWESAASGKPLADAAAFTNTAQ